MLSFYSDLGWRREYVGLEKLILNDVVIYLIDSENARINSTLKADAEKFVQNGHYEMLMEAKESGESVRMYSVGSEAIVNGFVMIADEGPETTFIYLDGKMNRDDLERLIAEKIKD